MVVDNLLAEFGARTGMGTPRRNAQGVCRLVFDGEYLVDVEAHEGADAVHLSCVVGPFDAAASPAFVRRMLAANLMGQETGGAALALDEVVNEIVLCRSLPSASLDYAAFERIVEAFVAAAERWRKIVDEADAARPAASAAPTPSEELHFIRI